MSFFFISVLCTRYFNFVNSLRIHLPLDETTTTFHNSTNFCDGKKKKKSNKMGSISPVKLRRSPLKNSGSIDHLEYVDVTPIIGREYPTAKLKDILDAPNSEDQIRDLAITICERGVVFFRAPQDDLTVAEQKHITDLLGKLTGRPKDHGLHVHPLYNDPNNIPMADGTTDENM